MLAAGLLILKIIGFLLLGILGLILAVLLLVLLVPVRYRGEGRYEETLKATASVSWLLHILSCKVIYDDDLDVVIRVFGFRVGNRDEKTAAADRHAFDRIEEEPVQESVAPPDISKYSAKDSPDAHPEETAKETSGTESVKQSQEEQKKANRKNPFSFEQFCDKLREIQQQKEEILGILKEEENRKTFRLLLRQLKALIKHILPRKIKGRVKFGFDDPYKTGQVLMYVSPFYGIYRDKFQLIPVFEETVLEGEVWFRGRIRIGTILAKAVRVLLDKNFRRLLKQWRN